MGFTKTDVLMNNVSFTATAAQPAGCGTFLHTVIFDRPVLKSGQSIQYSRLYIRVQCNPRGFLPPVFFNPVVKTKYNGLTQKQLSFPTLPDAQVFEIVTTNNFKVKDNQLFFEFDFACLDIEYLVYVDLFYELNTEEPPVNEDLNQEEESKNGGDEVDYTKIAWIVVGAGALLLFAGGLGKGLGGGIARR